MLNTDRPFHHVDPSRVIFVYRQRDCGRLMRGYDRYRAKNPLLQLAATGPKMDADPSCEDI